MSSPQPILQRKDLIRDSAYINGLWVKESEQHFDVTDPATNQVIAQLPDQSVSAVNDAIDAAYEAFHTYKNTTPRQRAIWLRNFYNLMLENINDLGQILTWENGKALADSVGEIRYAASYFEWYAEEAPRVYGTVIQPGNAGNRAFTIKQPIGVCGLICPWNFPSAMITRKAAAALAAGCTVVIKPDAQTPLSALALAALAEEAGFPKGAFNVVLADKNTPQVGVTLCESPKVKKVSFTGSTRVGKLLMKQASTTMKKLSFELGGNAPFIVFENADLDHAVDQAIASKFRGLGQTCVCANRLYVQESVVDKFAELMAAKVRQFVLGHGLHSDTTHGCMINGQAIEKVEEHKKDAIEKGAKIVLEGGPLKELGPHFYNPAIVSHVPQSAKVSKEETFGPLCPIFTFKTTEEVVKYANDTDVGLASYVFSRDINTIYTVSEALEVGMVSCNTGLFSDATIPFGGVKESGFGREGSLYGLDDYTVVKVVTIGGLPNKI
ncbi:hypothetical protein ZYGR_0A02060 [Zygosaccharomyces rouxii]|uniref:Succinate-semialdehyde dehydrogenase n=2 Tax=Zygosaccharomyces rouxii TaxID=4956 RepID=C5DPN0_ZYGRC|nr:uncharacterized protein ZYRO0A04686g [Zygosaccharomyces rouxii]KAH9198839.1 Aldehyde/histidinol dehydrogenase [Zygosaccharomyces rouxii]GAV46613.1 hypothetical protein ZYGR_0A02060 [Zygosaccharomyces rouxii]CAR25641.1 ZYRO0A04686p [Zygosaccharomyces rouxii]